MQFKQLLADDDAVSPVIGVILMVAITVILAAVIGTFVLGLGEQVQDTSPNSQFEFTYDSSAEQLQMEMTSGQSIPEDQLKVSSDTNFCPDNGANTSASDCPVGTGNSAVKEYGLDENADGSVWVSDDVEVGTTFTITAETSGDLDSAEVSLIWTSEGGDQGDTLRSWSGPNA